MIWKYPIEVTSEFKLTLPKSAQFLSLDVQFDPQRGQQPFMWFLVPRPVKTTFGEVEVPVEERYFRVVGTGHEMGNDFNARDFLGTFQLTYNVIQAVGNQMPQVQGMQNISPVQVWPGSESGSLVFHVFERPR